MTLEFCCCDIALNIEYNELHVSILCCCMHFHLVFLHFVTLHSFPLACAAQEVKLPFLILLLCPCLLFEHWQITAIIQYQLFCSSINFTPKKDVKCILDASVGHLMQYPFVRRLFLCKCCFFCSVQLTIAENANLFGLAFQIGSFFSFLFYHVD